MPKSQYVLLFQVGDIILVDGRLAEDEEHLQVHIYPTAAQAKEAMLYDPLVGAILSQLKPRYLRVTGDFISQLDFFRGSSITPKAPFGGPPMPELRRVGIQFKEASAATVYYAMAREVTS